MTTPADSDCRTKRRQQRTLKRLTTLRRGAAPALAVAAAAALGLAGAGGTQALLQDKAVVPGATITAGTLDLRINGESSPTIGSWDLSPTAPQAHAFTVTNIGDVAASLSAKAAITTRQTIGAHTEARLTPVSGSGQCRAGLHGTRGALDGYTVTALDTIPAGQTKTYCLELSLQRDIPGELAGQGVSFSLIVDAAQKRA